MANSLLLRILSAHIFKARLLLRFLFRSNIFSQGLQTLLIRRGELCRPHCIDLWSISVVGLHPDNQRVDYFQKLEAELYSLQRQLFPPVLCHALDGIKASPRTRVEELPGREDIQNRKGISVRKSLQPVSATPDKNEVIKWLAIRIAFYYACGNLLGVKRIPIAKPRRQLTPRVLELLHESARQQCSCPTVRLFGSCPLPLLDMLRLLSLSNDRSLSGFGLLICSHQSDHHGDESCCCGRPAADSRDGSPIEVTGITSFKTRSQVLKLWHMHSPLRIGSHSATACHHQETAHG